ncbi:MAG: hypothetical protein IJ234_04935, partial [Clostridia bacterium]|nr:hypothetical protein [Clostridia bacterium]
ACYTLFEVTMHSRLEIHCYSDERSELEVYQDDVLLNRFDLSATRYEQVLSGLLMHNAKRCVLRLRVTHGTVDIESLATRADE